jgi:hypothetical protein
LVTVVAGAVFIAVIASTELGAELPAVVCDWDFNDDVLVTVIDVGCNLSNHWHFAFIEKDRIRNLNDGDRLGVDTWEGLIKVELDEGVGTSSSGTDIGHHWGCRWLEVAGDLLVDGLELCERHYVVLIITVEA